MNGICPVCKETVPLLTIKEGELGDISPVYNVCFEHKRSAWIGSQKCEGSGKRPIVEEPSLTSYNSQ